MAVKTYQDSKDKYLKEKVDTFVLRVPKGKKDEIMEYAKARGMSLNGYITELIFADMQGGEAKVKKAAAPVVKTEKKKKEATKEKSAPTPKQPEESKKTPKVQKTPEPAPVQEAPGREETETKKKKMPSFLL